MRRDAPIDKRDDTPGSHIRIRDRVDIGERVGYIRPKPKRKKTSFLRRAVFPLLMFCVIVAAGLVIVGRISQPFLLYSREKRATDELRAQLESCRKENAELERRIKYIQTPEGAAQAARELGWVKPGEITLVMPESKPKPKQR